MATCWGRLGVAQQVVLAVGVQKALEPEDVARLLSVCLLVRGVIDELLQAVGSLLLNNLRGGARG